MMRVLVTAVSATGIWDHESNRERMLALDEVLKAASKSGVRLVVLPAGYFSVEVESEVLGIARIVATRAKKASIAVVGGIDLEEIEKLFYAESKKDKAKALRHTKDGTLPAFGFAVDSTGTLHCSTKAWRQTTTQRDDKELPIELPGEERVFKVGKNKVLALVCGEMHNAKHRESIGQHAPDLITVSGHRGLGQGLHGSLVAVYNATGAAVCHSQHLAANTSGCVHFVNARGEYSKHPVEECMVLFGERKGRDPFWVVGCVVPI